MPSASRLEVSLTAPRPRMCVVSKGQLHLLPLMLRMAFLPYPAPLGHLQTLLEDGACLFVQEQLCAKLLQRAFRKRSHIQLDSQCYLPLQVEGGPTSGFVIRNPFIRLQHQRGGQQARRYTWTPIVGAIQSSEVLVAEQLISLRGQEPVEVPPADEVRKQGVRLKHPTLRRPLTQHSCPLSSVRAAPPLRYPTPHVDRKTLTPLSGRAPSAPGQDRLAQIVKLAQLVRHAGQGTGY